MWTDRRLIDLLGIEHPIIQAPMAGPNTSALAIAVSQAGGLGSLPCAMLSPEQIRAELNLIRQQTSASCNVNFFAHTPPAPDAAREAGWRARLEPYYQELAIDTRAAANAPSRAPYDATAHALMLELRPKVVSFHFGLPDAHFVTGLKAAGCVILSSATTVEEARWLEARGVDAVIAQGAEAGGHRGMFLTADILSQAGTFALVPQVVDAVKVPVIAAGGIADARGIVAALALGAAGVQIGTAYLFTPECKTPPLHRAALKAARDDGTQLTNIFSGRPARGIVNRVMRELGPIAAEAPAFPLAGGALAPLKAAAELKGSSDFTSLWSGQAASLARELPAGELTRTLAAEAQARLRALTA